MKFEDILKIRPADIEGMGGTWADEHQYLHRTVLGSPPGAVVEIGVLHGTSAMFLCGAADEKGEHFYCMDPWTLIDISKHEFRQRIKNPSETELAARKNIALLGLENYTIFKNYSYVVVETFDEPVGFIFIDGCHCTECVKRDFLLWAPKMVPGGVMVFHDRQWDTVDKALKYIIASPEFTEFHVVDAPIETYVKGLHG